MNQPKNITVEKLTKYSFEDSVQIGKLLPQLSDRFSDQPIAQERLEDVINSPMHAQFVARTDAGQIVGIATVSITIGIDDGRRAWLEAFVVDADFRGGGVSSVLWEESLNWCKSQNALSLDFTSKPSKVAAHRFYKSKGAEIRDTAYFRKTLD